MHSPYFRIYKNSDTVVLFIHGFQGSPRHFDRFVERVPDEISVYNLLLSGHGGSVRDFAHASMNEWKTQVETVLKELLSLYKNIYIVGHSMGTFFALNAAVSYPQKIRSVFLLQSPLKIGVRPYALINSVKALFNVNDKIGQIYKNSNSIKLNFRFWEYLGWIPRYLELFRGSKEARRKICDVKIPCFIFQSEKDELVSMRSLKFIPQNEYIDCIILKNSAHFIYDINEFEYLLDKFSDAIRQA